MAVKEKIRIRIKGYDVKLVDAASQKIIQKQVVTILRSVHVNKDSREQFEMRTHKRLIDILKPSNKTVDSLMNLELPAGVEIEIKL